MRYLLLAQLLFLAMPLTAFAEVTQEQVNVRLVTDEAEAVLNILANGRLTGDEAQKAGFSFFGTQGPWYTVGWQMSVLIEKTYGRAALIESFCDQRKLLSTYNRAAEKHNRKSRKPLSLWSESLIDRLT